MQKNANERPVNPRNEFSIWQFIHSIIYIFILCSYYSSLSLCKSIYVYSIWGKEPYPSCRDSVTAQHLTKCMDYHQIQTVIIPINFISSSHYLKKVQMVRSSTVLFHAVQSVHHSWQMEEQLLGINIGFYLEKYDKLCKFQRHLLWELHWTRRFPFSTLSQLS